MTIPDALRAAHTLLRKAVPIKRRKAKAELGILAQTFIEAMEQWDRQKAAGTPLLERVQFLQQSLKSAWPMGREWKYLCHRCWDFGLEMHTCPGDATCGRDRAHLPHDFGTPCWCSAGGKFKAKPKPSPEDYTQATKSKPTRIGTR